MTDDLEKRCREVERLPGPQQNLLNAAIRDGSVRVSRQQVSSAKALARRGLVTYDGLFVQATLEAKEAWDAIAKSFFSR